MFVPFLAAFGFQGEECFVTEIPKARIGASVDMLFNEPLRNAHLTENVRTTRVEFPHHHGYAAFAAFEI
jgi:hypothetical protein